MKVIIYIDGFNLYYRALKNTPFRWLDLAKLCQMLLPRDQVVQIRYYTALVKPWPDDPQKPVRQQVYLRALQTIPNLSISYGQFLTHKVKMPVADSNPIQFVRVLRTDEKGSDVNLATHLLRDGFRGRYEGAVVLSNDSDLAEPIRVVSEDLKKVVGILTPSPVPSKELLRYATFYKHIRPNVLKASQFPQTLQDAHGQFHKPTSW